ncbi:hypothetical protein R5R35_014104 [Gryllus longicercus]|uniref:Bromo domain-containing protein n=1 Tax=Gryllus longicercus TaxID=2509291 RepID=A0AAN9VVI8_9ORTH
MGSKKHKKHKSEKKDRYEEKQFGIEKPPSLKLILKVGSSSTPEHSSDSPGPTLPPVHANINYSVASQAGDEESHLSTASFHTKDETHIDRQHRKAKKKKKKKEKDKDKEKHEKKHKHHHKEKRKRPRDESSQDDISVGEESLSDPPLPNKRIMMEGNVGEASQGTNSGDGTHLHQGQVCTSREPRSCVLRQRQERSALQRLLDHLLKGLEKRDPQQFFAWPVTDHIAPGYSQIISQPMDFSTMKQKIDDGAYSCLGDFIDDFKLMCNNAMVYNHPETIYYKAAKKLLHVGLKFMSADKLKPLRSVLPYLCELTRAELGFELGNEDYLASGTPMKSENLSAEEGGGSVREDCDDMSAEVRREHRRKMKENRPLSKFEAIPDDLTPEEILQQAQNAAKAAADKLSMKQVNSKMGFLRQKKDGSTSLAILIPTDGVTPGTNERPVSLGAFSGKLTHGTGQLQGFREDRRNLAKTVKPLYYGAFGSYAPSYDSTFANLTKEESDLVYQTYGDETAVQYAESIQDFTKDCDYTLTMVDNLLDLLTGGEHRRTKRILEERRKLREEEERVRQLLEGRGPSGVQSGDVQSQPLQQMQPVPVVNNNNSINNNNNNNNNNNIIQNTALPNIDTRVDFSALKSLSSVGLDVDFLDELESHLRTGDENRAAAQAMQVQLDHTSNLLQKLQQVQSDRLSMAPPPHLSQVALPSDGELQLAEKITDNLKDMAKKVNPIDITSVPALRKAMGILPEAGPPSHPESPLEVIDSAPTHVPSDAAVASGSGLGNVVPVPLLGSGQVTGDATVVEEVDVEGTNSQVGGEDVAEVGGLVTDLESELREFLESGPPISSSPLHDDKTIEEILSES